MGNRIVGAPRLQLIVGVIVALLFAVLAETAAASPTPFMADFETGDLSQFSTTSTLNSTLSVDAGTAYDGTHSGRASYAGGGANGYARGNEDVSWATGDDVWYGEAVFLPTGFKSAMQGEVDLLRWDDWQIDPTNTAWGGVVMYGGDKRARLLRFNKSGAVDELVGPFDIPEGSWNWIEVHQRFSPMSGDALSSVYLNGQLVGSSSAANTYGNPIERIRFGLVAISENAQTNPLNLWFDRAYVGTAQLGPAGAGSAISGPPSVDVASPVAGATVSGPVTLAAHYSGVTPVKIRYYADGAWIGYATSSPWSTTWDPYGADGIAPGQHQITARAYDAAGDVVSSSAVSVTVAPRPTVTVTSPGDGAAVSQPVTVSAEVSHIDAVKVRFYVDGRWIGYDASGPWSITWDPYGAYGVAAGSHVITARAYDAAGHYVDSASVQITVS